jgi:hypothetical protein
MIGNLSLEKGTVDQRLENYDRERRSIEKKLGKPTVIDEQRGRLEFRKNVIQKKAAQLAILSATV